MRSRGFTLIELLVVLVVLSTVTAVAVPRLSGVLPGARLRGAGHTLAADLRYLYAFAVSRRAYVRMTLDLDAGQYWAETFTPRVREEERGRMLTLQLTTDFSLAAEQRGRDATEVEEIRDALTRRRTLPPGVEFAQVTVAGSPPERQGTAIIEFSPWGYGDDATVELSLAEFRRTVRLNGLLGEATVGSAGA